jgi:DNA segregation ATPase FtsK/SpoIIIE-like protein
MATRASSAKAESFETDSTTALVINVKTPQTALEVMTPFTAKLLQFQGWFSKLKPAKAYLTEAQGMIVRNQAGHAAALEKVKQLKAEKAERERQFKEGIKDFLNGVKAGVMSMEHEAVDDLQAAITHIDNVTRRYEADERERARVEEEKRRKAEEERLKKERDAQAKAAREAAAKAKGPEKQELKREAEIIASTPITVNPAAVAVAPRLADVAGVGRRKNWKSRVKDGGAALWKAVLAGRVTNQCFVLNTAYLDSQAKALEDQFNAVNPITGETPFPGVEAYNDDKLAGSGR